MAITTVSNSAASTNPDIPVATDQIGGEVFQKVKVALGDNGANEGTISSLNPMPITAPAGVSISGTPNVNVSNSSVPVAPAAGVAFDVNAVGELIECLEAMRQYQISLNRTIGMLMPDTSGRMRVLLDAITNNLTLSVVSQLTNVVSVGNAPAAELVYGAMHVGADSIRRNITIS